MKFESIVARPRTWYQNFGIKSLESAMIAGVVLVAAGFLVQFPGSVPPSWHRLNGDVSDVTGKVVNGKTVYYPTVQFLALGYSYETAGAPTTDYPTVGTAVPVAYDPGNPDAATTLSAAPPNYFKLLFPASGIGTIAWGSYAYARARRRARPELLEVASEAAVQEEAATEESEVPEEIEAITELEVEAPAAEEAAPEIEAAMPMAAEAAVQPEEVAVATEAEEVVVTAEPEVADDATMQLPGAVITPTEPPAEESVSGPKKPSRAAKAIAKMAERKEKSKAAARKAAVGVSAQRLAATLKKPGAKRKPAKPMLVKAKTRKSKQRKQSDPKKEAIMLSRLDHND